MAKVDALLDVVQPREQLAGLHVQRACQPDYQRHIDQYLTPRLGSMRLIELERNPDHIEDFFSDLTVGVSGKPLSPASIRRIHATLRNALNAAVRKKLLSHNPAWSVELPPTAASGAKVWNAEQAGAFLDFVRDDPLRDVLRHTCASLALAADVPMKVVSDRRRALDGEDHGEPVREGAPGRRA